MTNDISVITTDLKLFDSLGTAASFFKA